MFKAKDIGDLLGIKDIRTTLRDFDKDEWHSMPVTDLLGMSNIREVIKNFNNKQKVVSLTDTLGGQQNTTFLTEQGLYKYMEHTKNHCLKQRI